MSPVGASPPACTALNDRECVDRTPGQRSTIPALAFLSVEIVHDLALGINPHRWAGLEVVGRPLNDTPGMRHAGAGKTGPEGTHLLRCCQATLGLVRIHIVVEVLVGIGELD